MRQCSPGAITLLNLPQSSTIPASISLTHTKHKQDDPHDIFLCCFFFTICSFVCLDCLAEVFKAEQRPVHQQIWSQTPLLPTADDEPERSSDSPTSFFFFFFFVTSNLFFCAAHRNFCRRVCQQLLLIYCFTLCVLLPCWNPGTSFDKLYNKLCSNWRRLMRLTYRTTS